MRPTRRLDFLVAGDSREEVTESCGEVVWNTLAAKGFADRTSIGNVGFWRDIDANKLLVVLPKAFSAPSARLRLQDPAYQREQIYRLIRIFQKIRRETKFKLSSTATNQKVGREKWPQDPVLESFDAALRLRRDYRLNGMYFRRSHHHAQNKSHFPIDWRRTIRKSDPILSDRGILYPKFSHRLRRHDPQHPLSMLLTSCLKEIFSSTGERSDLQNVEGLEASAFRAIKNRPKAHLRELRGTVFDDRGRFLLDCIGAYLGEAGLRSSDREVREELLAYSKSFEDIWEQMLRNLLAPTMKSRDLPVGQWCTYPAGPNKNGIGPVLDILLEGPDADVIVDAKDYRVLNGSKLLGSQSDYYKQIIYRLLLSKDQSRDVLNILAFPGLGQKSLFEIRGAHTWPDLPGSRVFVVTVDYDLAAKTWLREAVCDVQAAMAQVTDRLRTFNKSLDLAGSESPTGPAVR